MGQVAAPFGVKGWLKVKAFTENVDALIAYPTWWVRRDGEWSAHRLEEASVAHQGLRAKLAEIADRCAAQLYRGCDIAVPKSQLPETQPGEFYWTDLIGLEVRNLRDERFGTIEALIETGATDVLVVKGSREHLIPTPMIAEVALDERRVVVDWGIDY